jgi:hypothetical protein
MQPLMIHNARWKHVLGLLASLGFVATAVLLVWKAPPSASIEPWETWAGILFFGACAVVFFWRLFDSKPRLIIDDSGIVDNTLGVGLIPWSEILDATVRSLYGNDFICLTLRDPELWLHKLSPTQKALLQVNRALGFTELNINLAGVSANTAQIHELILKMSAAARRA